MSLSFASDNQNTGASASASVLPVTVQDLSPLRLTGLISLLSKGLSGVFSSTTVQKLHQMPKTTLGRVLEGRPERGDLDLHSPGPGSGWYWGLS